MSIDDVDQQPVLSNLVCLQVFWTRHKPKKTFCELEKTADLMLGYAAGTPTRLAKLRADLAWQKMNLFKAVKYRGLVSFTVCYKVWTTIPTVLEAFRGTLGAGRQKNSVRLVLLSTWCQFDNCLSFV
jgi:hypothetical protein